MILPDVNVLLYAFRSDSVDHQRYRNWLEEVVTGPAAYGMSPQVLSGVVRIATHPKIFARPSRLSDAVAFSDVLLNQPNCQVVQPGVRHWSIFSDLCKRSAASGNIVPDAWLAAVAIEAGCEWITNDRDFARFPGLRWATPFQP
jgi:uncharacterized protein